MEFEAVSEEVNICSRKLNSFGVRLSKSWLCTCENNTFRSKVCFVNKHSFTVCETVLCEKKGICVPMQPGSWGDLCLHSVPRSAQSTACGAVSIAKRNKTQPVQEDVV